MNKPTKSEVTPGLILRSTEVSTANGEVVILSQATGPTVRVEAFDYRGEPYTRTVRVSSLRWQ